MVLRTNERQQENGSLSWMFAVMSKTGLYYGSMDFRDVGGLASKNSLIRLILLDKHSTQQNGISGELGEKGKWFVYLATLTRNTN